MHYHAQDSKKSNTIDDLLTMNEKNETISRILIAVDGSRYSEKAFEYGLYLARKCRCYLLIVHVIEEFVTVGHSISKELKHQDHVMLQEYESRAKNPQTQ